MNWIQEKLPAQRDWIGLAYDGALFVAVSNDNNGYYATSPDGASWTERSLPVQRAMRSIVYGGGIFVALADFVSGKSDVVFVSPDGINWTEHPLPAGDHYYRKLSYCNGIFFASDGRADIAISLDGKNWVLQALPNPYPWYSVVYGNGLYVLTCEYWVPVAFGETIYYATSPDGASWTVRRWMSGIVLDMIFADGMFIAPSNNNVYISTDGLTWISYTLPVSATWRTVIYGGNLFVAVAFGGQIISSSDGKTWTKETLPVVSKHGGYCATDSLGKFVTIGPDSAVAFIGSSPIPQCHLRSFPLIGSSRLCKI